MYINKVRKSKTIPKQVYKVVLVSKNGLVSPLAPQPYRVQYEPGKLYVFDERGAGCDWRPPVYAFIELKTACRFADRVAQLSRRRTEVWIASAEVLQIEAKETYPLKSWIKEFWYGNVDPITFSVQDSVLCKTIRLTRPVRRVYADGTFHSLAEGRQ